MEIIDLGVDFIIGEKEYKVQKLSIVEALNALKTIAKKDYIDNAEVISKSLSGKEKSEFLISVWKQMPDENELIDQAEKSILSIRGIITIIEIALNKIGVKLELQKYITKENISYYADICLEILGLLSKEIKEEIRVAGEGVEDKPEKKIE